jgi:nicotinate-nucleotide adenylyltransferase
MKAVGIFAGTFDPVHPGHIAFSLAAKEAYQLDKVYFIAERFPRTKKHVSTITQRESLLKNALESIPGFEVLSLDDDSFTVNRTMPKLQEKFPDSELILLMGSDVAIESLPHWDNLDALLPQVSLAIGLRDGYGQSSVTATVMALGATYGPIDYKLITTSQASVSSTQMRQATK